MGTRVGKDDDHERRGKEPGEDREVKPIAVVVDWWGPYIGINAALDRVKNGEWEEGWKSLYMGLGSGNVCEYVGRSMNLHERLKHHRSDSGSKLNHDARIYVGRIVSPGKPGPRKMARDVPDDLDFAERMMVFVLQPADNEKLQNEPPEECGVVFSRLFDPKEHDKPTTFGKFPPKFPVLAAHNDPSSEPVLIKANQLPGM